jgi:hypothetical protein
MKYCIIKNTTTVIDGSENTQEVMLQNAESAGVTAEEVEILTEQEFEARKALEPTPPHEPTAEERIQSLEDAMIFLTLGGM